MSSPNVRSSWFLWLGFGGILCLLAFAGLYDLSTVQSIGIRNEEVRRVFLQRDRILEQIRAELYACGTRIRDLLLDMDSKAAQSDRNAYLTTRDQLRRDCQTYARLIRTDQQTAFQQFDTRQQQFFEQVEPALLWSAKQRQANGLSLMKDILIPERASLVQLLDQLSLSNARQLEAGSHEVADLFRRFNGNLGVFTIVLLCVGVALALFTARRVLSLEGVAQQQLHELQELSSRLVEVGESERRAIARELHDEVGQTVSGLLLGIGNVASLLSPAENDVVLTQLHGLRQLAERTVASVRNLSLLLRPSMLDDLGLVPALQWQAREVSRDCNIDVRVAAEDSAQEEVAEETKICIYRIVQEALKNVARHAAATAVSIQLSRGLDQTWHLYIEDDGRGFAPSEKGLGLLGMEERVRHLHGSFQIQSGPRQGTKLSIHLPS